jgi:2-oxoglutarate ferredoxin oxidoreductase subunit alpha
VVKSSLGVEPLCEAVNLKIHQKYEDLKKNHTLHDSFLLEDAELVVVSFGIASRICRKAIRLAREEGLRAGLLRPITLFPFPSNAISAAASKCTRFLVVEMNLGQMIEDVQLGVNGKAQVDFFGRAGGVVLSPEEILEAIKKSYPSNKS